MKTFLKYLSIAVLGVLVAALITAMCFPLSGCAKTGYPGNVPTGCKVSDGYCYHHLMVGDASYTDVYTWGPRTGWVFHHREDVRGVHVPLPHCENAEAQGDTTCYNYSVSDGVRQVDVFEYRSGGWVYTRHRNFEDK